MDVKDTDACLNTKYEWGCFYNVFFEKDTK
jgi:hypothetical protein